MQWDREKIFPFATLFFYSDINGLADAQACWGGQTLPIEMLILCKNTLTDTPGNNV